MPPRNLTFLVTPSNYYNTYTHPHPVFENALSGAHISNPKAHTVPNYFIGSLLVVCIVVLSGTLGMCTFCRKGKDDDSDDDSGMPKKGGKKDHRYVTPPTVTPPRGQSAAPVVKKEDSDYEDQQKLKPIPFEAVKDRRHMLPRVPSLGIDSSKMSTLSKTKSLPKKGRNKSGGSPIVEGGSPKGDGGAEVEADQSRSDALQEK